MRGRIALVGGDEFRAGCVEMDRQLLAATRSDRATVLILPTAAAHQNPNKAVANGIAHFEVLGAAASGLMVIESSDANDEDLLRLLDDADVVYLTGGDPAYLLEVLTGSLLLDAVTEALRRGKLLAGSSAGAMVMGPWMRYRGWRKALGVVQGIATLPHHEHSDPSAVAKEMAETAPSEVTPIGVDAQTCCYFDGDGWRVLGQGKVTIYEESRWRTFAAGDSIPIDAGAVAED